MGWNTQTWKHDQKKNEIIKGTNTFSQQCIYNGALAKEKKSSAGMSENRQTRWSEKVYC